MLLLLPPAEAPPPPPLLRVRETDAMPPPLLFMPVSAATSMMELLLLLPGVCVAASAQLLLGALLLGRLDRPLNDRRPPLKDRRPLKDAHSLLRPLRGLRGAVGGACGLLGGVRARDAPRMLVLLNRPVLAGCPLARALGDMMSPSDLRELHAQGQRSTGRSQHKQEESAQAQAGSPGCTARDICLVQCVRGTTTVLSVTACRHCGVWSTLQHPAGAAVKRSLSCPQLFTAGLTS